MAKTTRYTVAREIERENLKAEKIGRTWVIDVAEAKRWAAQFRPYAGLRKRGGGQDVSAGEHVTELGRFHDHVMSSPCPGEPPPAGAQHAAKPGEQAEG